MSLRQTATWHMLLYSDILEFSGWLPHSNNSVLVLQFFIFIPNFFFFFFNCRFFSHILSANWSCAPRKIIKKKTSLLVSLNNYWDNCSGTCAFVLCVNLSKGLSYHLTLETTGAFGHRSTMWYFFAELLVEAGWKFFTTNTSFRKLWSSKLTFYNCIFILFGLTFFSSEIFSSTLELLLQREARE